MRNFLFTLLITTFATVNYAQTASPVDYTASKITRYKTGANVLPAFIPLEIGEITPKGWILDWAKSAASGITGHLDDYEDVYKYGWMGFGFKARGVKEEGTGWPLEQCSYWLDGGVKLAYILKDTMLIRKTSDRLNLVVNGVLSGGETFIYWKSLSFVNDGFNNWGHGLMGRALVSYYQATHDPKILQALEKVYKTFPLLNLTDDATTLARGTINIDAMTETYLMTGNRAIRDSIISYSKRKISIDAVKNWNNQDKTKQYNGHAVTFYEVSRVPAMMYPWTANSNELKASENFIEWGEKFAMLPNGVCTSEERLAGIGSIRCVETCNIPTSMWSFLWMLRVSGNSKWCDKVENVFFNAGPAPVSRDFKTMSYYHASNRFNNKLPEVVPIPGEGSQKFTDHGHEVLCCVGNVNYTIPNYISNMWMATMDNGLAATLYGPCSVTKKINNANLTITTTSSYPFDDKIEMKIEISKNTKMPIYLRIPEWCKTPSISINGKAMAIKSEKGFVKVKRTWKNNDNISIVLPMSFKVNIGHETPYPQIDYYLKGAHNASKQPAAEDTTVNNPFQYASYGPLLLSYAIADSTENKEMDGVKFNYALNVNPKHISEDVVVMKKPLGDNWSWQLSQSPIQIKVKAKEINWVPTQLQPLPATAVKGGKDTSIFLVPYGCTKFRVTMFPLLD